MRIKFTLLYLMFGLLGLNAQKKWTLEECINTALTNNLNIQQQKLVVKSKQINYQQSKNNLLPNFNANVGQTATFGRSLTSQNNYENTNSLNTSFSLTTNLLLFDGLKMKYDIEARKKELLKAQSDNKIIEKEIILNVTIVFLQVLQTKELVKNAKEQITITEENINKTEELIQLGKLAEGEIYQLQAQLAKEELHRIKVENQLRLSLLNLSQILNLEENTTKIMDISEPSNLFSKKLELLSVKKIYTKVLQNHPEIKSAEYQLQADKSNIKIAKSYYIPRLNLNVNWQTAYYNIYNKSNNIPFEKQLNNNSQTNIKLTLSIPIFNRLEVRNNIKKATISQDKTKLKIETVKKELRKKIEQYYLNAVLSKKRWEVAQKLVKANQTTYLFAMQKLAAGKINQYEVNIAKNNLSKAISEQTQAKYEYIFRLKLIELI